ncbi:DUF4974 domain-containing protein [Puteibacter caeruleilacunae]|nr:DUF4974 domain-containing protein [Puteibacter caeruleilacunae]
MPVVETVHEKSKMTEKESDKFWDLAAARLHEEISEEELSEFTELLEDDQHRKNFRTLKNMKDDFSEVKKLTGVSRQRSWGNVSNGLRGKTIKMISNIVQLAAVIVLAFVLGGVLTNWWNKSDGLGGYAEVKVPLGQMSEMTLIDGTKVWLNSGTTLRYNNSFGEKERQVSMEGEAFFDVTSMDKPFKVKFKGKEVEVLGTQFNVVAYHDDNISEITLLEGQVKVNNQEGETLATLKPSEQITINETSNEANIRTIKTRNYISWREGKIVFDEEKLSQVAVKLERWYNVDIQFADSAIGEMKFTGTVLKNKPFDQIIAAFEVLLPLKIKYTRVLGAQDKVIISIK